MNGPLVLCSCAIFITTLSDLRGQDHLQFSVPFGLSHNAAKCFTGLQLQFQISIISHENWKQMQLLQSKHLDNHSGMNVGHMFISFLKKMYKLKKRVLDLNHKLKYFFLQLSYGQL